MDRPSKIIQSGRPEVLLRAANDSLRPLSTVEAPLAVRPAPVLSGATPVWRLDPQYAHWLEAHYPHDPIWFCPLDVYDLHVRPADGRYTLEQMHDRLLQEAQRTGGYALSTLSGWRRRTAMCAVGGYRQKAWTSFLFAWG